ncbi:MAG: citrate synthase [Acidobacteriota bacterium]
MPATPTVEEKNTQTRGERRDAVTVVDHRTGKSYDLPVTDGTIRAIDLRQIKTGPDDFGLMSYDPAFMNTASCRSEITFIDGDRGILRYRGYPIEQLAERSNYLEVAYLLLHGELPGRAQYDEWVHNITFHTMIHESLKTFMDGFNHDAHPMGMLIATVGAMSTFYPGARDIHSSNGRTKQIHRLIAKMPTLAAFAYRHSMGMPYVYPDNDFSYTENFLNMLFRIPASSWRPDPVLVRALDVLFILHADHEQNCGTHVMRGIGSSHTDPYSAVAGAAAALYGPLHGGANEEVLKMLQEIGSVSNIPAFIEEVKSGKGEKRLMGFGHRVYKNFDPRATIIKKVADEVFQVTRRNPLLDVALELEKIALQEEYFIKRRLYPNVDFYSGLIYEAIGIPTAAFTVLFAIPRVSGWLAQWQEMLGDPEQKIARPRQIYTGAQERNFVPIESR